MRGVVMGRGRHVLALGRRTKHARLAALLDVVEPGEGADTGSMIAKRYEAPVVPDTDHIRFTRMAAVA